MERNAKHMWDFFLLPFPAWFGEGFGCKTRRPELSVEMLYAVFAGRQNWRTGIGLLTSKEEGVRYSSVSLSLSGS